MYAVGSLERNVGRVNCLPDVRIATSRKITIVICSMNFVTCERNVVSLGLHRHSVFLLSFQQTWN